MNITIGFIFIICLVFLLAGQSNQSIYNIDVLVIGGSISGISEGIQFPGMGVSSVIVKETPWLGGMLTAQGIIATDGNKKLKMNHTNRQTVHVFILVHSLLLKNWQKV